MAVLATVDQLAARLGVTLTAGTPDYARAEANIEDVSARAVSVAGQPGWTVDTVPAAVRSIVLAAARRVYTNPDRYLSNMAGSFQATLASGDFNGDIFMAGEVVELRRFRATGSVWVMETYRGDLCGPDASSYFSDGRGGDDVLYRAVGDP